MTSKRNYVPIQLLRNGTIRTIYVDEGMEIIEDLDNLGVKTIACCTGHGEYKPTIFVETEKGVVDICSGKFVDRKRNFYTKDKKGFYKPVR